MIVRPSRGEPLEQLDQMEALTGVGSVERLVEQQHRWVVHEGGRDLDALLHPLRVTARRAACGLFEVDFADGRPHRLLRGGETLEPRVQPNELVAGERPVHGFPLRHEAEAAVERRDGATPAHRAR